MSKYAMLPNRDEGSPSPTRSLRLYAEPWRLRKITLVAVVIVCVSMVSSVCGYFAGQRFTRGTSNKLIELNEVPVTFKYQFNFSGPPSNITDQRWQSLFPAGAGFFTHPSTGHDVMAFSVFHQLHCLDGIRQAYWSAKNGHQSEGDSHSHSHSHSHQGAKSEEDHIRHCFEFIRQTLVCTADTTLEHTVKAPGGGIGVSGFGTEHVCKDYDQLLEWVARWENP